MSIYATWLDLSDDNHEDGCAIYTEVEPGIFDFSGKPCDCGTPSAPVVYEGSHVLPSADSRRGGSVDLAAIPNHITRDGRDDGAAGLHDWLRLSVENVESVTEHGGNPYIPAGRSVVLLDRRQVERVVEEMTEWLDAPERF